MVQVKKLLDAGLPIPAAIKHAMGMSVAEFAEKHRMPDTVVSGIINGARRATDDQITSFIAEMGGTPNEWRELLWRAGKPDHVSAA